MEKKHFHKNPSDFRIYADFEADNEIHDARIGNKTTDIYKQNPVVNGYEIVSELEDVLKSGYHKSSLGHHNVDWFVNEVIELAKKCLSFLKTVRKISLWQRKMKKIIELTILVVFGTNDWMW